MKKDDKKKQQILMHLSAVPIASGQQLQTVFQEYRYPEKRVSHCLSELEKEGLVEGMARPLGKSKVWRLTRKGRSWMDVRLPSVVLSSRNLEHYLAIASVYFSLQDFDSFGCFLCEPRFAFIDEDYKERTYAPDGFFTWEEVPYFLEVQRSYMTRKYWREKWRRAESFFRCEAPITIEGHTVTKETEILVLSDQSEESIRNTSLSLRIGKELTDVLSLEKTKKGKGRAISVLLAELRKDVEMSKTVYSQECAENCAPFSQEALRKYERWLDDHQPKRR